MHEICAAIHLHTSFSDGSVDFDTLRRTAKEVGLDCVMVTDHMSLEGYRRGLGGFDGDMLVIVGYEHDDVNGKHHYLAFGIDKVIAERDHPQHYIDGVRNAGGIGFIAHPFERRRYFRRLPAYPWHDWNVNGFDGIEIWNQMSDWVEELRSWVRIVRFAYPRRFLTGAPRELLALWDKLNQERLVAGLGGVDAHTRVLRAGPFHYTVFPLKVELKGIRTHLYLEDDPRGMEPTAMERAVLDALRDGHGFVSNFRRGDARGARIYLRLADGSTFPPGRLPVPTAPPAFMHVVLPLAAQVRLIRNGEVAANRSGAALALPISSPGVYRVEAYRERCPWIYSNPFRVGLPHDGARD
ncbi:MAG: histidinol-phosphatase [Chitinivibrionales bacterium]|nr:histidinol-phosphatase [Chitinivibrionales bacterium]